MTNAINEEMRSSASESLSFSFQEGSHNDSVGQVMVHQELFHGKIKVTTFVNFEGDSLMKLAGIFYVAGFT